MYRSTIILNSNRIFNLSLSEKTAHTYEILVLYICGFMYIYIYIYMCVCVLYIYIYVCVCVCVIHIYIYICVCVCVCVWVCCVYALVRVCLRASVYTNTLKVQLFRTRVRKTFGYLF